MQELMEDGNKLFKDISLLEDVVVLKRTKDEGGRGPLIYFFAGFLAAASSWVSLPS